ncbi:MAG: gliding motility-associated C-terminal domain-containing protein [Saprospiraceae bacterium]|nr:gliding motility-associated C-terminal domain-containing protein [Saprospiraceae bacterium]
MGDIFVPNVFSPNGDQINDRISVWGSQAFTTIDIFRIYSRWGELVFEILIFQSMMINPAGMVDSIVPFSVQGICIYLKAKRRDGCVR